MTSPPREIAVECPECDHEYVDWYRPSINLDLDDFDDEYLDQASSAVCPRCGYKVYFSQLIVRDDVFVFDEHMAAESVEEAAVTAVRAARRRERKHPVNVLFRHLEQFGDYPSGVVPVRGRIPGVAFFPGGAGLWGAEAGQPLPPMPVDGVMVLGHDFHSETGFLASLREGSERPATPSPGYRASATWTALLPLLAEAGIALDECFFTNVYMGLRQGDKPTGRFPGAGDPDFKRRCADFLCLQLELQRPSLIITLGGWVPRFLASLSPQLAEWKAATSFTRLDDREPLRTSVRFEGVDIPPCTVVALTHPSFRGPNVGRRRYEGLRGEAAERGMLRDAVERARWTAQFR